MANTIKLKRSSTSGNKLTGSNSVAGEMGVNTADKALFIQTGDSNGSVVTVAHESTLKIDEVNGRIGIGSSSPDKALVVQGASAEIVINDTDATDTPRLRFRESGTTSGTIHTDGSHIILSTGSTERLRVQPNGELRINSAYDLPASDGSANEFLQTDGSGNVSFVSMSSIVSTAPTDGTGYPVGHVWYVI